MQNDHLYNRVLTSEKTEIMLDFYKKKYYNVE